MRQISNTLKRRIKFVYFCAKFFKFSRKKFLYQKVDFILCIIFELEEKKIIFSGHQVIIYFSSCLEICFPCLRIEMSYSQWGQTAQIPGSWLACLRAQLFLLPKRRTPISEFFLLKILDKNHRLFISLNIGETVRCWPQDPHFTIFWRDLHFLFGLFCRKNGIVNGQWEIGGLERWL